MAGNRRRKANATGRSDYERFIALPHFMLKSHAWARLSPNGKALLLDVWSRHNGRNNGQISYAVREAISIGLSKDQASRAFRELQELGFLVVQQDSAFTLKTKDARLWLITAEASGDDGRTPATKAFMRVSDGAKLDATKSKSRSHQRDAQSHQRDSKTFDATILPLSVAPARPSTHNTSLLQSHQRDTYNLPYGLAESGAADITSKPGGSLADSKANPTNAGRQHDPEPALQADLAGNSSGLEIDPKKIGVAAKARLAADGLRLRHLATAVGVSPSQLSNRLAGRYGLNPAAEARLRAYVAGGLPLDRETA